MVIVHERLTCFHQFPMRAGSFKEGAWRIALSLSSLWTNKSNQRDRKFHKSQARSTHFFMIFSFPSYLPDATCPLLFSSRTLVLRFKSLHAFTLCPKCRKSPRKKSRISKANLSSAWNILREIPCHSPPQKQHL